MKAEGRCCQRAPAVLLSFSMGFVHPFLSIGLIFEGGLKTINYLLESVMLSKLTASGKCEANVRLFKLNFIGSFLSVVLIARIFLNREQSANFRHKEGAVRLQAPHYQFNCRSI